MQKFIKAFRYYRAYGPLLMRDATYSVLAKLIANTGFSPLMREYEDDVLKIQTHHLTEFPRSAEGVYTMPGCTATIETPEEYVLAYLRRGLYKNFWLRKKPRRVKMQYYPFPERPAMRQSIAPFMLYLMTEAEADAYSEADAVINDNVDKSVMDMSPEEADEYWRAKSQINEIGTVVMQRLTEEFPNVEERVKFMTNLGEPLEGGLEAATTRYKKQFDTSAEKKALDMKASKYVSALGGSKS